MVTGPITRRTLSQYADASGDDNGLHTDPDHARRAGHADVFAHGMLSAAYLARVVTGWVDQAAVRSLSVRFVAITHLDDEVHCRATVAKKFVEQGEKRVTLELLAQNQRGEMKIKGNGRGGAGLIDAAIDLMPLLGPLARQRAEHRPSLRRQPFGLHRTRAALAQQVGAPVSRKNNLLASPVGAAEGVA